MLKHRLTYLILSAFTMLLGLLSRSDLIPLPRFFAIYAGDFLWALLVFWLVCFLFPHWQVSQQAALALGFSYLIELSQLVQTNWLNQIRHTTIGALILGFGFSWSDVGLYTLGVLFGMSVRYMVTRKKLVS